jgi:hypothetical protein
MPRRYNLRARKDTDVKWIEDETLKDQESEEEDEDEDYEPSECSDEEEEVEDDEEEESEDEKEHTLHVPIPKNARVTVEIDTRVSAPLSRFLLLTLIILFVRRSLSSVISLRLSLLS